MAGTRRILFIAAKGGHGARGNHEFHVGANYLELGVQSYNVRGIGLFKDAADIGDVSVSVKNSTPVYVKQLGEVSVGAKTPMGRVGRDEHLKLPVRVGPRVLDRVGE